MMDKLEYHYVIKWVQSYPELQELIDRQWEELLQSSDLAEAKAVIDKIKSTL